MFRYSIQFRDELDGELTIDNGIVAAESYENAITRLLEYVGRDNFVSIECLYQLDDILNDDELKDLD